MRIPETAMHTESLEFDMLQGNERHETATLSSSKRTRLELFLGRLERDMLDEWEDMEREPLRLLEDRLRPVSYSSLNSRSSWKSPKYP
jgi:hypothetical protein